MGSVFAPFWRHCIRNSAWLFEFHRGYYSINIESFSTLFSFHNSTSSPHFSLFSNVNWSKRGCLWFECLLKMIMTDLIWTLAYKKMTMVICFLVWFCCFLEASSIFRFFPFWTGFDLNLPLHKYGAVDDFDFVQNLLVILHAVPIILKQHVPYKICMLCLLNVLVFSITYNLPCLLNVLVFFFIR